MPRKSDTLSLLPDSQTELEQLVEFITTGGSVEKMNEDWKEKWERIKAADDVMRNTVSSQKQLQLLRKHELFKGLSRTQLWRYRDAVQEIYGATHQGVKRYKRLIAEEKIERGFKLAKKMEDGRLYAAMLKQYCDLWGLDNHDDESAKKIEPQANLMVVILDGKPHQFDLNNPASIPEDIKHQVIETIFHTQTPTEPTFLDASQ